MKRLWLIILAVCCFVTSFAQPQFRNTTSFDTGDSLYYWSARIGARLFQDSVFDDTTTGYHVMSSCIYNPDLVGDSVIKSIVVNATYETVPDTTDSLGYHVDTLNFFTDTCRNYGVDANNHRFFILGDSLAGLDNFTTDTLGHGMQRIPPGYTHSIRLGCMVNSQRGVLIDSIGNILGSIGNYGEIIPEHTYGSQSLYYTMRITNDNALVIINYAIVARRFDHDAYDAGEFLVRIVQRDSSGEWANEPINDSLWYKVSAPQLTTELTSSSPWRYGSEGGAWPCSYVYKPWNKCAVNLNRFIGQDVRIEFYSSNCIWGVDPLYAYIVGDYMSPILSSSGCPEGTSPFVDTLRAPDGMKGYEWFVSSIGPQEDLLDYARMDTVPFRRLSPYSTSNVFCPSVIDFVLNGDTLERQTFMCVMYSALDPAKPFPSKLYVNVYNHRPIVRCATQDSCDRGITFVNTSAAPPSDSLDPSATYWVIYDDLNGEVPLDTVYRDTARYIFPEVRSYLVEQHVAIAVEDSTTEPCSAAKRRFISVKGPSVVPIYLSDHSLCEDESHTAQALLDSVARMWLADGRLQLEWQVDGHALTGASASSSHYSLVGDTLLILNDLEEGRHTVELLTTNYCPCSASVLDSFFVYENPRILTDPSSGNLCLGDTLTLTAFRDDRYEDSTYFDWSVVPPDPDLEAQQGSPVLRLSPRVASTYTLHPSSLSHCQLEDVSVRIEVWPYPVPQLLYAPLELDLDNPSITVNDLTDGAEFTYWTFSDGTEYGGPRAMHTFWTPSVEGIDFTMRTCNQVLCCSDTSVHVPLGSTSLWIPDVFSPSFNDDNNCFQVFANRELLDFTISIFNRQGLLVYQSSDPHFRWDGTDSHGRPLPQAAYVYTLHYRLATSDTYYYSATGTVTLLR